MVLCHYLAPSTTARAAIHAAPPYPIVVSTDDVADCLAGRSCGLRGHAHLQLGHYSPAADEFRGIIEHRGELADSPLYPLAACTVQPFVGPNQAALEQMLAQMTGDE